MQKFLCFILKIKIKIIDLADQIINYMLKYLKILSSLK